MGVCLCIRAENLVNGLEQVPECMLPLIGASLDDGNKFVQVDINVGSHGVSLLGREMFPSGVRLGLWCACVIRCPDICGFFQGVPLGFVTLVHGRVGQVVHHFGVHA